MVIQIVSMDALVWNTLTGIGRKAALGEANSTGHSSAKIVPSELGLRRQQASAPASASAQQPPAETKLKACKNPNSSLVISPLLPPPSPFPVPLKFLWFNKTGEVGVGTNTKPELDTKEQFNCNCEAVKTFEQIEESFTEDGGEESTRITALDNPDDSLESSAEQTPPKLNSPAAKECTPPGNNAQHSQDRGDADYISPNNENNPEKSDQVSYNNWVERIMEFRSYWKEQRKCDPNSSSNGSASSTEVEPCLAPQVDCSCEMHASNIDHGICCNGDEFLCYCSLMKQEPISMNDRDSFSGLLRPVPFPETKFYVQMSFLCARAYAIPTIKPRELWKLYGLRFVTSSLHKKSESTAEVTANAELQSTSISSEIGGVVDSRGNDETNPRLFVNPSVAYEIAASAASYIHSQTKYILPFKSESSNQADNDENLSIKTKQRATVDKNNQMNIETEKEAEVAVADQRAPDTDNQQTQAESSKFSGMFKSEMATVVANSSVTALVATEEDAKQGAAKDLQSLHSSPCGWFICDDDSSHTRYFVIQGSDSLASWQANLFFEPTQFENFEVLVHRGIYEAARGMYEQLLPEILSHLGKHGENARFRFTGHSLGGSLSLLVNLMLLIRGVVSITSLLPVITFGSPCIMCGGDYLLQKLGLPNSHVQAVMMHRDIVPRAFACEYPVHVSEFLKRLNVSFRNHPCLSFQNVLYGSMGQLLILQPDEKLSPPHPLLPSGSGFYILHHAAQDMIEHENELSDTLKVRAAQSAFLNTPHPLEILSDRCAYGSEGSISRDHDASNYLNVINYILRQQIKHLRKLQRKQRKQIWWPLVTADSSMPSHRPSQVATKESKMSKDLRRMCR